MRLQPGFLLRARGINGGAFPPPASVPASVLAATKCCRRSHVSPSSALPSASLQLELASSAPPVPFLHGGKPKLIPPRWFWPSTKSEPGVPGRHVAYLTPFPGEARARDGLAIRCDCEPPPSPSIPSLLDVSAAPPPSGTLALPLCNTLIILTPAAQKLASQHHRSRPWRDYK